MRLLIAVKSCRQDFLCGYHQVIRNSWGKDVFPTGAHLLFFLGDVDPALLGIDEEFVNVRDDYAGLPYKTREICRRSVSWDYDFVFICDTDSFVLPEKLLKCGFEQYDYYGLIQRPLGKSFQYDAVSREGKHHPSTYLPWASGGYGYFLSKHAAAIIAETEPDFWAEDLWVGQIMNEQYNHGRVTIGGAKNLAGQCSWHFPAHEFNSGYDLRFNWMPKMYERHK
jgi:hypothetical protein